MSLLALVGHASCNVMQVYKKVCHIAGNVELDTAKITCPCRFVF